LADSPGGGRDRQLIRLFVIFFYCIKSLSFARTKTDKPFCECFIGLSVKQAVAGYDLPAIKLSVQRYRIVKFLVRAGTQIVRVSAKQASFQSAR
jgi:hypothetical protein